jgi:hypothetical protein
MSPAIAKLWHHSLSGAKQKFYCSVYYITSNSNSKAQRASKNLKKMLKIELEAKINARVI